MLDILAEIYDSGERLVRVRYALFEGDPRFVTAVELQFESRSVVLRAVADDDTLAASLGELKSEPYETLVEIGDSEQWSSCVGYNVCWAWQLTNQQGYSDGVRLEFGELGEGSRVVIELIVAASAIQMFAVAQPNNSFNQSTS
jgi:Family of unknown function (DUF6334)